MSSLNATTSSGIIATADNTATLQLQTAGVNALNIDASQRAAFVAGTAAAPAITTAGDTNTGIFFPAADITAFTEGGVEAMRIDSNGSFMVGTTTPNSTFLSTPSRLTLNTWGVGPTNTFGNFYLSNASGVGVQLTSGSTSWSALSDERIKTDLKPIQNAVEKVSTLRAVTGRYIKDEDTVSRAFLIAQDVQAVLPEAVDAGEDEEQTLQLKYTDTIPLLVAAIKELKEIVDSQAERIKALEAK
jgi:hypothetical protein